MANIIICADGTWNRPEESDDDYPTNILKLARAISPVGEGINQHVFYDWGIGSYHNSILGGAMGQGLEKNILDCYRYIVQNYNDGDKIYLFGFSRGAYTVRALSGLINNCGIIRRDRARCIPDAWKLYKSEMDDTRPSRPRSIAFREQNSYRSNDVCFIGVWDTVGALGIPRSIIGVFSDKDEFYDTELGSNVSIARHALAIDEKRTDFEPTLWEAKSGLDLKQVWFAGVHSDIGGSYPPDDSNLLASDISLEWMLGEAMEAGLSLEQHIQDNLSVNASADINESRTKIYRLSPSLHRPVNTPNSKPSKVHNSVKTRYENDSNYRPPELENWVNSVGWDNIEIE